MYVCTELFISKRIYNCDQHDSEPCNLYIRRYVEKSEHSLMLNAKVRQKYVQLLCVQDVVTHLLTKYLNKLKMLCIFLGQTERWK